MCGNAKVSECVCFDMNTEKSEQKPGWPREVWTQPTYETMLGKLGLDDDGSNPSVSDVVHLARGQDRICQEIHSWEECEMPEGHEFVDEDDEREWEAHLVSKQRGR